jgi:uncharacterized protein (DUF1501 family)
VNEGGATGYLAGRLGELGRGLAGYADEIGAQAWRDTVVVVISEFGRTFRENGNRGADHGHGSVYWVTGGGVRGGAFAGDQVQVTQANLNEDRDYPVLTDYRRPLPAHVRAKAGSAGGGVPRRGAKGSQAGVGASAALAW